MRKLLVSLLVVPPLLVASGSAYRILQRDWRYDELVERGDALLVDGLPVEAARSHGAAIALDPDDPIAYVKRAEAHRQQGHIANALEDLQKAGSLSKDELLISSRLAELFHESGRFAEAAAQYEKILALVPDSPHLLYKLGLAHFLSGRQAEAIEALTRASLLQGTFWQARYLRGAVFRSLGDDDEAERDFRAALDEAPEAHLARSALIDLYLERELPQKALPLVRAEIDSNPADALPYLHLADIYRWMGRTRDAIIAVGLALDRNPSLPEAYLRLGELWLEEASPPEDVVAVEKAIEALTNVLKMDPGSGAAALALGKAYLALGDEPRGFAELQRASEATPVEAEALLLLGDLYRARNNPTEAVTAYHVYLKLSGDAPAVLERLGDAYVECGKPELAAQVYMRLAAREPGRVDPLVKASRAFLMSGDSGAAARECRRGLAANPENAVLLELLAEARGAAPPASRPPSSLQ